MDDEKLVSQIARDILVFEGFDVEICDSGQEAVEMYEKAMEAGAPFDAILLDLTVRGGLGGYETLERIRGLDPDVKAIISSGYSSDPVMTSYVAYGFSAAVSKPYTSGTLTRAVRKVLSEK
jgi:CheY-like chemotaxis protein